jgi:phytanoyl-CoA hydroxylase
MPHAQLPEHDVPSLEGKKLFVNDGLLQPSQVGRMHESSPDAPLDELRRRYAADGYLFLKALLPREDVLKAREEYFKMLAPSGVLKPNTLPVQGIFDSDNKDAADFPGIGAGAAPANGTPGEATAEKFVQLALQAHYADWYKETFCKHPVLKNFVARLTGWGDNTVAVRRSLLRNNTPGNKAIGVHYDQIFLRHGEPTSVTAWVPMGDVSLDGGGLIYLENGASHTPIRIAVLPRRVVVDYCAFAGHSLGREVEAEFTRKAAESGLSEQETKDAFNQNMMSNGLLADGPREYSHTFHRRWLVTSYEAGDVVLHTPYAVSSLTSNLGTAEATNSTKIHASTLNHDPDNIIRVGTDLRFVDGSKPWDRVSKIDRLNCILLTFQAVGQGLRIQRRSLNPPSAHRSSRLSIEERLTKGVSLFSILRQIKVHAIYVLSPSYHCHAAISLQIALSQNNRS